MTEVKGKIIPDEQPVVTSAALKKETKHVAMLEIDLDEKRDPTTGRFLADTLTTGERVLDLNKCQSALEVLKQGRAFFGPCPGTSAGEMDAKTIVTEVSVFGAPETDIVQFLIRHIGGNPSYFAIPSDPVFNRAIRDPDKRKCVMVNSAAIVGYSTEGLRWPVRASLMNYHHGDDWSKIEPFPFQEVCNWDASDNMQFLNEGCLLLPGTKSVSGQPLRLVGDDPLLRAWHKRLVGVPLWEEEEEKSASPQKGDGIAVVDMTQYLKHPASPTSSPQAWLVARFWPFLREATIRLHPHRTAESLIVESKPTSTSLVHVSVDRRALAELYGIMIPLSGKRKLVNLRQQKHVLDRGQLAGMGIEIHLCNHGANSLNLLSHLKTLRKEQAWGNRDEMVLSAWDKISFRIRFELQTFVNPGKVDEALNRKKIARESVDHDGLYVFKNEELFRDMVKRPAIYQQPLSPMSV
jgi:hypothetical protein